MSMSQTPETIGYSSCLQDNHFQTLCVVELGEDLTSSAKAVDRGRHTRVDGDLQEDLPDLVTGDAVGQRGLDVRAQFMWPVEYRCHGQIQHAARLAAQAVAPPHRTPAVLGDEILQGAGEVIGFGDRFVYVILTENFGTDFAAPLIGFAVQCCPPLVALLTARSLRWTSNGPAWPRPGARRCYWG